MTSGLRCRATKLFWRQNKCKK